MTRMLPFGRMLPLHCCCDPALRLGWVPRPLGVEGPCKAVYVAGHPTRDLMTGEVTYPERIYTEVEILAVEQVDGTSVERLAVKSNDVPIETWRKVPGFIEDRRRT